VNILFRYIDHNNLPRKAQRQCPVVPEVNDSVYIVTEDDMEYKYTVEEREWSFNAHPSMDTDLSVTVTLAKDRYNLRQRKNI